MSAQAVLYDVADGIATITLNRPNKMNTFNKAMFSDLNGAMARFRDDETAGVAILTAAGDGAFSAGLDIDAGNALVNGGDLSETSAFELDFLGDDMGGKPVVFACFGHCVGQAAALGGWADIRIAADDTLISLPEAKIGISAVALPGLLVDLLGGSQASYALLYGGALDANWGLRSGFFHEVMPRDALQARARAIALEMMKQAPLALQAHKLIVRAAMREPRDEVIAKGQAHRQITLNSRDFREGMSAFLEKRPAQFEGR